MNAQMPWHHAVQESQGKLLAWYHPDKNLGYDHVLHLTWDFLEHKVPIDTRKGTGLKVYLTFPIFRREQPARSGLPAQSGKFVRPPRG